MALFTRILAVVMMHIVSRMILELVRAVNPDLQKGLGAVAQFDGLAGSRG